MRVAWTSGTATLEIQVVSTAMMKLQVDQENVYRGLVIDAG